MEEEEDEVNHSAVCLYISVSEEICVHVCCVNSSVSSAAVDL